MVAGCPAAGEPATRNRRPAARAAAALRERGCGAGISHALQLLGEDCLADPLLERHILGDLGIEQQFPPPALGEIDGKHHLVGGERNLPPQFLLAIGAAIER